MVDVEKVCVVYGPRLEQEEGLGVLGGSVDRVWVTVLTGRHGALLLVYWKLEVLVHSRVLIDLDP